MLPAAFLERMRAQLGAEFEAFHAALLQPRTNAIRVNALKLEVAKLEALLGATFERVSWSPEGLYVPHTLRLGAHALHHAGAYYVQEASAQAVARALNPQPGERVLDLCAAPGGKSTHLAALMHNSGVFVANEPVPNRARVLAENLERLGVRGAVTQEEPHTLADKWGETFDRVLIDAPCSGEGMFRKSELAVREWSPGLVAMCARRQASILESAAGLLRPGGTLVYSTCTFAVEENEDTVSRFLEQHPEFALEAIPELPSGFGGIGSRLMPHVVRGEGHFVALLRKIGSVPFEPSERPPAKGEKLWRAFAVEFGLEDETAVEFRNEIQLVQLGTPSLEGLRAVRAGVPAATVQKDRLEPHHALSHLLDAPHTLDLELDDPRVAAYLRGEVLESPGQAGWVAVRAAGLGLGWGKRVAATIKNHYPKALRGQTVVLED
jgi:NOL1/NOP2/sun family putative RNA methylase